MIDMGHGLGFSKHMMTWLQW